MPRPTKQTTGRPRLEPTTEDIALILRGAQDGCALIEIARGVGISKETLARWRDDHPAVGEALEVGRAQLHTMLRSKLIEKALAGETVPLLFALKCMFGWKEGEPVPSIAINVGTVSHLSGQELRQIANDLAEVI